MTELKFPWMRAQLISYLRGLADHEYQLNNWQLGMDGADRYDEMDYTVNFFFDDTNLSENPASLIGDVLYDGEEARKISSIAAAINVVFDRYGLELRDLEYIEKPEWMSVVENAKSALPLFEANRIGWFE